MTSCICGNAKTVSRRSSEVCWIPWSCKTPSESLCQTEQHKKLICLMKRTVEAAHVGAFLFRYPGVRAENESYWIIFARPQMQLRGILSENQSCACSQLLSDSAVMQTHRDWSATCLPVATETYRVGNQITAGVAWMFFRMEDSNATWDLINQRSSLWCVWNVGTKQSL